MAELAAFLRALRERAGLSQNELSLKSGLSETYYGKIEGEARRPSPAALLRLLSVLSPTPDERHEALRLFAVLRFPGFLEELAPPRPQSGTAAPAAVPSPKRGRSRHRIRRGLLLLAASGTLLGPPPRVEASGPITAGSRHYVARRRQAA